MSAKYFAILYTFYISQQNTFFKLDFSSAGLLSTLE